MSCRQVLVGAHASILGNILIGNRAKIGCGSVVLAAIPTGATAVGAPAKVVGRSKEAAPGKESDNALMAVESTAPAPRAAKVRSGGSASSSSSSSGGGGSSSGSSSVGARTARSSSFSGPLPSLNGAPSSSGDGRGQDSRMGNVAFGNLEVAALASSEAQPEPEAQPGAQSERSGTPPRAPPRAVPNAVPSAQAAERRATAAAAFNDAAAEAAAAAATAKAKATVRWSTDIRQDTNGPTKGLTRGAQAEANGGFESGGGGPRRKVKEDEEEGDDDEEEEESADAVGGLPAGSVGTEWASWRSIWRHLDEAEEGFLTAPQFHERLQARGHSMTEAQVSVLALRGRGPRREREQSKITAVKRKRQH